MLLRHEGDVGPVHNLPGKNRQGNNLPENNLPENNLPENNLIEAENDIGVLDMRR
jgi:hypothetical protein